MFRTFLACFGLLGSPLAALDFAAQSGYYAESSLPAEILCPASGWFLAPDGQLIARAIGAEGVTATSGAQCRWTGSFATCTDGAILDGVLTVPAPDVPPGFKRLTDLGDGRLALGRLDGSGTPVVLQPCPPDFTAMLPGAGPAEFAALPPPANIEEAAMDPVGVNAAAWERSTAGPLPVSGVFAPFPRTSQSEALLEMTANNPEEMLAQTAMQYGLADEDITVDDVLDAMRTGECGRRPIALTSQGLLVRMSVFRPGDDGPPQGGIEEVAACALADQVMTCTAADRVDGGWRPGDGSKQERWLWVSDRGANPWLCNPDRGADADNSCVELVTCPAEQTDLVTMREGVPMSDMASWEP